MLCPAGRRHTLTTHLACLRLTSNIARALPQSAAIRSHQPGRCGYLRAPAAVRNPAASSRRPVEACARSVISPLLRVSLPQTKARPCRPQRASRAAAVRSHPQPSAWPLRLPACASRCQKSCSRPVEACARSVISPLLRVALPQTKARPCRHQRASCAAAVRSHPPPSA